MTIDVNGKPRLVVVGSSGHASVLADAIELAALYLIVGYLDDSVAAGTIRRGYPVLGRIDEAEAICTGQLITAAAIAIGDNWWRRKIYRDLTKKCPNLEFPVVRHPSAVIATSTEIGKGTAILAGSHVGPGSRVGEFCILNTGSSIDHDCNMSPFASIAPGVFTGGLVRIGECSAVGVGASVSDRISIGNHSIVGTGAAVVRDIPDFVIAYGNPAKAMRSRQEGETYPARSSKDPP